MNHTQLWEMTLQQQQTLSITAQHHLIALLQMLANKRNTTGSVPETPIEWCNKDFHAETITSIPFSRIGAAISFILSRGILDRVLSGVARSMT